MISHLRHGLMVTIGTNNENGNNALTSLSIAHSMRTVCGGGTVRRIVTLEASCL